MSWVTAFYGRSILYPNDEQTERAVHAFRTTKVEVAAGMRKPPHRMSWTALSEDESAIALATQMLLGAHRVPIVNATNQLVTVVTQTSFVEFISKNVQLLGSKSKQTLGEMTAAWVPLLSVSEDDELLDAFNILRTARVGGVAVLNEQGSLVGNISARDIKRLNADLSNLGTLYKPVKNALPDPWISEAVYCLHSDTLQRAIEIVVQKKIHRVYIVDEQLKPTGVLTLSDIIKEVTW